MLTVALAIAMPIALSGCIGSHDADATVEARQKSDLLRSLHRGMTRVALYDTARRLGVTPRNPDYVRLGPNGGAPIDNGDFPMPDAAHAHPTISIFMDRPRNGCGVPVDLVTVYFDQHDQVAKWYSRLIMTGDCL